MAINASKLNIHGLRLLFIWVIWIEFTFQLLNTIDKLSDEYEIQFIVSKATLAISIKLSFMWEILSAAIVDERIHTDLIDFDSWFSCEQNCSSHFHGSHEQIDIQHQ